MKKWFLVAATSLFASAAMAQVSIDPEIGLNINSIKSTTNNTTTTSDAVTAFRAGIGIQFDIAKGFYIKPGVYFSQKGGSSSFLGIQSTTALNYLEIPVNIGYAYKINGGNGGSIFAEVAPYLGLAIDGKVKVENIPIIGSTETDINFGSANNETNGTDFGFNFGIGYVTPWNVYVKGQYGLGLGNLNNNDNTTTVNRGFNVAIGYKIAL